MNVNDLIRLLEKIETKSANVYLHNSSQYENEVLTVVVQHNILNDEVDVILKTRNDN